MALRRGHSRLSSTRIEVRLFYDENETVQQRPDRAADIGAQALDTGSGGGVLNQAPQYRVPLRESVKTLHRFRNSPDRPVVVLTTDPTPSTPSVNPGAILISSGGTERHLFALGWSPMSAVEAMIGSQATKGMHMLVKFAPDVSACGVWTKGSRFTAIETYPTACRRSPTIEAMLHGRCDPANDDLRDARLCALVAYLFGTKKETLTPLPPEISDQEGWIWIPRDAAPPAKL